MLELQYSVRNQWTLKFSITQDQLKTSGKKKIKIMVLPLKQGKQTIGCVVYVNLHSQLN